MGLIPDGVVGVVPVGAAVGDVVDRTGWLTGPRNSRAGVSRMPSQLLRHRWAASGAVRSGSGPWPGAEERVRELVLRRGEAVRAGDVERLVADYLPDVVVFPPGRSGRGASGAWVGWFSSVVGFEVRDLCVVVSGAVAFCHCVNRVSAVPVGGVEAVEVWLRSTLCLRLVDGAWRVAHEHVSQVGGADVMG